MYLILHMKIMNIQDVSIGQYLSGTSVLHKLDPRTKIISTFLIMIYLLSVTRVVTLVFSLTAVLLLYRLAGISLSIGLRNLRPFIFLFLLTIGVHTFFSTEGGGRIIPGLPVTVSVQGLYLGFFYSVRISILIVLANLLTLTTAPMSLTDAVEFFLKPLRIFKVPAHEISMMLSIALRFFPILLSETDRIRKAQVSRGATFEGPLRHKINMIVTLIVPLFVSTFRKANELAMAMDARCYGGSSKRTSLYELKFRKPDTLAFGVVASLLVVGFIYR